MAELTTSAALARLRVAALDQVAGRPVGSGTLVQLGLDALLAGVDTPSLRRLAALGRREEPDARELFDAVVDELGLRSQIPADEVAALWLLARETAGDIVSGRIEPLKGAQAIWKDFAEPLDYPRALMPFVNAVVEAGSGEPRRRWAWLRQGSIAKAINADIVRAARGLSADPPTHAARPADAP